MRGWSGSRVLRDAALKLRALAAIAATRCGLRVARWTTVRRLLRPRRPGRAMAATRVARAVSAMARRIPGTGCLARSLVTEALLRRHGHAARLRLGVRRGVSGIEAHAWVECAGLAPDRGGFAALR